MAADERITALQKAYADIILNTAKEAAARIMMSERKAQRFQRELQVAKDEALRMLLRLKQMMDSKITEAELTSLNQRRKIEELEAQLQEAEDIVKDLREELREVQSELERVRNNKEQHLAELQDVAQGETSEENRYHSSESVVFHPPESEFEYVAAADMRNENHLVGNEFHKFYGGLPTVGNSYNGYPDLPSIFLRSKEPELYRNGCTQRIRASEGSLLDKELSLSGKTTKKNDEIPARENEIAKEAFHPPIAGVENQRNSKKKAQRAGVRLRNWQPIQSFTVKRKRANRYRNRFTSSRNLPHRILGTDQAPSIPCLETHRSPVRTDVDIDGGSLQLAQRLSSDKCELGPRASCAEVSQDGAGAELVESCGDEKSVDEDMVTEKLVHARKRIGYIENSVIPCGGTVGEEVKGLLPKSQSNDIAHETPSEPINERIIKFTFQRKRKKESSRESNESTSLENASKRQALDKQNDTLDQEEPNLIAESSPDSLRLVQVAQQLISLSEKKWWQ